MTLKGWNVELLVGLVDVPQGFHVVGVVGLARVVVLLVVLAVVVDEVVVSSRTGVRVKLKIILRTAPYSQNFKVYQITRLPLILQTIICCVYLLMCKT